MTITIALIAGFILGAAVVLWFAVRGVDAILLALWKGWG